MKMRWFVVVLMGAGVLAAQGQGAGPVAGPVAKKRPMTFTDLMAMKRVSDPQISPSGKWVMFSVTDVSLEKNTKANHLWVVRLDGGGTKTNTEILSGAQNDDRGGGGRGGGDRGGGDRGGGDRGGGDSGSGDRGGGGRGGSERQITFGDGESNGRFSPDGKTISLTRKDQIFAMPWDEAAGTVGAPIQVTNVAGGADGAIWSPDSKRLMFVASVYPECSVKGGERASVDPTHSEGAAKNGAPGVPLASGTKANTEILTGGQNDDRGGGMAAWAGAQAAEWAEEDSCDKAKDESAAKSPVKAQVWDALLYRHWDHYTGAKRSHVLVVSATDGGMVRDLTPASVVGDAETPTFSLGGPLGYAWAPDSEEIAYVTNLDKVPAASTNNDVFTLRLDEAGAKAVKVSTSPGSDDGPAYSPDGKWLAFRSQARGGFESDRFRLMVFDRERKTIKEALQRWDGWVDEFTWAPNSARLYFASGNQGREPVYEADVTGPIAGTVSGLVQSGEFGDLRISPDGKVLVMSVMRADVPSAIVSMPVDIPTDSLTLLEHANDATLAALDLKPLEPFWFTGAEGTKVQGFILRPPGFDPAKKYPVKFLMHGGPQTAWGDAWSFRWNWQLMAADGYVVVGINRRGSTGYGQKFVDEVSGDWGGRAYVDLMKGLDYAEGHYSFLDKTRECALGASYGGFMADWVLTHTNRFKCIVTHDGLYDPASAYGDTEEMWFNEWEFRRAEDFPKGWDGFVGSATTGKTNTEILTGGQNDGRRGQSDGRRGQSDGRQGQNDGRQGQTDGRRGQSDGRQGQNDGRGDVGRPAMPWRYAALPADQDPFRKWSPMLHIQDAKTPTLVIHSQKDYRLDVSQGIALFTALQRLNVPSKMLYFPDEGHWVLKPQNSQMWNEVVSDWCDRWTKTGKYAEAGK
jgi:dipeptidyl aminopeptidase/acylaminoacyl peptidase